MLLVRFGAIGDLILTTPLVRALRRRHPGATLTFVTKARFAPLLTHSPHLDAVVAWDPGTPLRVLAAELRGTPFTHRLDLHRSLRSRALRLLLPGGWTTYPKHRVARTVLIRSQRDVYRDRRPVAERYFDAARRLDVAPDAGPPECYLPDSALDAADSFLNDAGIGLARPYVALAPGAAHATKRWPEHHWVALARRLVDTDYDVVVVGGPEDRAVATPVAKAGAARAVSAAGGFDLLGTAALLKRARVVVAGDTGLMHLATAVGTAVVALFGPTVEAFGFFPYRARAVVLQKDMACRPCSSHGSAECPLRHHRCLQDLMPDEVLEGIRRLPP